MREHVPELRVFVGAEVWALSGVTVFSTNLVRGLKRRRVDARILMTESDTRLVEWPSPLMPLPDDLPVERLPVARGGGWGAHWGAMIRFLEERAPCIYVPNSDWRHSCVAPLLSERVGVVGIVHSDDPMHYDHVSRLGRFWNAIVTVSKTLAEKTVALDQSLAERLSTIPIGVRVAERLPERPFDPGRPLEIVYAGLLNQHQKRILDLPMIMHALLRRGVDARLTLAGRGAQEEEVRAVADHLIEQGRVRFLGVLPSEKILDLFEHSDVFIMTSEFEGMPNALLEAMGRGCVPVVTDIRSGIPEVVRDGESGYLLPVGDVEAFVQRLEMLQKEPERRRRLSRAAYRTVRDGAYTVEDMVASYETLFRRVLLEARKGVYRRPAGLLSRLPKEVDGVGLFPVECPHFVEAVGSFPSAADASDFARQIKLLEESRRPRLLRRIAEARERRREARISSIRDFRVVVGLPYWVPTGVSTFCENLVRGLQEEGIAVEILLTEQDSDLIQIPDPRLPPPEALPVNRLPVDRDAGWGTRWGAMIRYLEERSPCVYLPNFDWRHSCVSPRLSKRVSIVGILHGDDPLHYDHFVRLAPYWDAIVAVSETIADRAGNLKADHHSRIATIPYGVSVPQIPSVRSRDPGRPLKVVCHGVLDRRQRRVIDLPRIVQTLGARGVPVVLTIIGGALEEEQLGRECQGLVEQGVVRFLGVLPNEQALQVVADNDVCVLPSAFEGLPNALLEAMARGCVPVVLAIRSGIVQPVHDGVTGFQVPIGDIEAFADRLALLRQDAEGRERMSREARRAVARANRVEDMVRGYLQLFQRVLFAARTGRFRRPSGPLSHPPEESGGVALFPVECPEAVPEGRFPSEEEVTAFRNELALLRESRTPRPLRFGWRAAAALRARFGTW